MVRACPRVVLVESLPGGRRDWGVGACRATWVELISGEAVRDVELSPSFGEGLLAPIFVGTTFCFDFVFVRGIHCFTMLSGRNQLAGQGVGGGGVLGVHGGRI